VRQYTCGSWQFELDEAQGNNHHNHAVGAECSQTLYSTRPCVAASAVIKNAHAACSWKSHVMHVQHWLLRLPLYGICCGVCHGRSAVM
jgi:hypothetical protein